MMFSNRPVPVVLTPCIGICVLDADGYCEGCHRTGDEIAAWRSLSDIERLHIMDDVLPERERRRG